MALSFKSVGHFFAVALQELSKVSGTGAVVEAVTSVVPGVGIGAIEIERAAYALLGEVTGLLTAGNAATASKLKDAGLDESVVASVEAVASKLTQLKAVVATKK